jgi:hypothetical protein
MCLFSPPLDERPTVIVIALGEPATMSLQRPTHVRNVIKLSHKATNDRDILEPALLVQTVRTFVSCLTNVYHGTLAHVYMRLFFCMFE